MENIETYSSLKKELSKYKDLIEAIDAYCVIRKLLGNKSFPPYIAMSQNQDGSYEWNIFYENIKINLGVYDVINNILIIAVWKILDEISIEKFNKYGFGEIEVKTNLNFQKTVITIKIDSEMNKEFADKIIKVIDLSFNV